MVEGYNTQQLLAENTNLDVSTLSRQLSRLDAKRLIKKK
ncbi:winged helix-turn-helix transcriptional regulator [Ligilactobacillus salivarius]